MRWKWIEDILWQYGKPCSRYIPHMYKRRSGFSEFHSPQTEFLYAAADKLFAAESTEEVTCCMRYICLICSDMLSYGIRKMAALNKKKRRKDGARNE